MEARLRRIDDRDADFGTRRHSHCIDTHDTTCLRLHQASASIVHRVVHALCAEEDTGARLEPVVRCHRHPIRFETVR
jgi:hypothetical protein